MPNFGSLGHIGVVELINLRNLTFGYHDAESPVLKRVNLEIRSGEFTLISGPTGSGKSTLLKVMNGLAPHFTGGHLQGSLVLERVDRTGSRPHELANLIGFVNQQPERAFVTDTVEEELAYGMEQLGYEPETMRSRVAEIANLFGLASVLTKPLVQLSGGMQQAVAIASAIAAGQRIILLDEPTSALDQDAAMDTLKLLSRLVSEVGLTVIIAEHRIERVIQFVDSVILVNKDGSVTKGSPEKQFAKAGAPGPTCIELSRMLDWNPIALNTSEAIARWDNEPAISKSVVEKRDPPNAANHLELSNLSRSYDGLLAVKPTRMTLRPGTCTVIIGENGAGKTSLLWAALDSTKGLRLAMVPQTASDLLFMKSVSEELAESDSQAGLQPGTTGRNLETLIGRINPSVHPRDLSSGQQLALVLAIQLAKGADLLLLDEPTRGLDYEAKRELTTILSGLKEANQTILLATHDLEFAAQISDQVLIMSNGEVIERGEPTVIFGHNGSHPSQMAKISRQDGLITLDQLVVAK